MTTINYSYSPSLSNANSQCCKKSCETTNTEFNINNTMTNQEFLEDVIQPLIIAILALMTGTGKEEGNISENKASTSLEDAIAVIKKSELDFEKNRQLFNNS